jgi:hypothetical protein
MKIAEAPATRSSVANPKIVLRIVAGETTMGSIKRT